MALIKELTEVKESQLEIKKKFGLIDAETGVVCATSMASFVLTETRAKGLQV